MDFYLDTNHGGVVGTIVEEISVKNKPILRLIIQVMTSSGRSRIFSSTEPEKMVEAI